MLAREVTDTSVKLGLSTYFVSTTEDHEFSPLDIFISFTGVLIKRLMDEKTDLTSEDLIQYLPSKCRNTDRLALNAILPACMRFKLTDEERAVRMKRASATNFGDYDEPSSDYDDNSDSDSDSDDRENDVIARPSYRQASLQDKLNKQATQSSSNRKNSGNIAIDDSNHLVKMIKNLQKEKDEQVEQTLIRKEEEKRKKDPRSRHRSGGANISSGISGVQVIEFSTIRLGASNNPAGVESNGNLTDLGNPNAVSPGNNNNNNGNDDGGNNHRIVYNRIDDQDER